MTKEQKNTSNVCLFELKKSITDFIPQKITSSIGSADYIRQFYHDDIEIYESFFILMLNRANTTIGFAKISQGGICGTVVDIKILAKYVIDSLASSVILAHNHPSGNRKPSEQDFLMTQKIVKSLSLLDTKVFDHIILTKDSYYSFADNGEL